MGVVIPGDGQSEGLAVIKPSRGMSFCAVKGEIVEAEKRFNILIHEVEGLYGVGNDSDVVAETSRGYHCGGGGA